MTLRVMFLVNSLCVGGAEKHVVSLVNGLDVRRHRLALTALKREEGLLPQIDQDQLADGLVKLSKFQFPVELNPVSRAFFEQTAKGEKPEMAAAMTLNLTVNTEMILLQKII
jgi:hypothetical protein